MCVCRFVRSIRVQLKHNRRTSCQMTTAGPCFSGLLFWNGILGRLTEHVPSTHRLLFWQIHPRTSTTIQSFPLYRLCDSGSFGMNGMSLRFVMATKIPFEKCVESNDRSLPVSATCTLTQPQSKQPFPPSQVPTPPIQIHIQQTF